MGCVGKISLNIKGYDYTVPAPSREIEDALINLEVGNVKPWIDFD